VLQENNTNSDVFDSSLFPALEALVIDQDTDVSKTLSAFFPSPGSLPSLKTLAFRNCELTEGFMKELARFAGDRRSTVSTWLYRVLIAHHDGDFPSAVSIHELRKHVHVVDTQMTDRLPADLT